MDINSAERTDTGFRYRACMHNLLQAQRAHSAILGGVFSFTVDNSRERAERDVQPLTSPT